MSDLPDIGDIFKDLVWNALVKLAISKLFAAVPWLGWGPIGVIVGWIAGMLAEQLYDAMRMAVDLQLIAFKNDKLRKAFDGASVTLKIIAKDKGITSPEFQEARKAHREVLATFVRLA